MRCANETLKTLARRMGVDNVSSRTELEAKLALLLRLVLRTGQGHPALLHWMRLTLPVVAPAWRLDDQGEPEGAAQKLARVLCSHFLQDVRAGRDTILSRPLTVSVPISG